MQIQTLIESLSRADAYPHHVDTVEVHQTHISAVFLAGPFAFKVKKPVNLGFVDFSTLDQRKHFCEEEVRLNRRLAPHVYLGVVPISRENERLRVGGDTPVEWAVQMKRLPSEATLESRLRYGDVTSEQIRAVAERIAAFHRHADRGPKIAPYASFVAVAGNARENFTQTATHVGTTISPNVFERVRILTEGHLTTFHDLIEARVGSACDTHGDLHLDHVYLFPDEPTPNDLVIVDCIEFADRFRYADPVADMAFLAMDLAFHGRRDLSRVFADAYFSASADENGRALVPFYSAYRAVVRAKVEGMELGEKEIDPTERQAAEQRARAHWLLALGELAPPIDRPALVMIAGLPGSGKSTLARSLASSGNFVVLQNDVIRKELAGALEGPSTNFGEGIYTEAWNERTYGELVRRTEQHFWQGQRVLIDANLREDCRRQPFFATAQRWGVPVLFIHCTATPEATRARLQSRRQDASDADWRIYERLKETWQPLRDEWRRLSRVLDTSNAIADNERRLHAILQQEGILA